jgi:deoxyribonuclease V
VPTVGVTNRLLVAKNDVTMAHGAAGESGTGVEMELPDRRGATMPFFVAGTVVGLWIRTRAGVRPIAAHAAWRTDPQTASALVLATARRARTPEPLRTARRVARTARDLDVGKGERRAIERLDSPTTGA